MNLVLKQGRQQRPPCVVCTRAMHACCACVVCTSKLFSTSPQDTCVLMCVLSRSTFSNNRGLPAEMLKDTCFYLTVMIM